MTDMPTFLQVVPLVGTFVAGGAAGALISTVIGLRSRFWSRSQDLENAVMDRTYLFELWNQAGDSSAGAGLDRYKSSYVPWQGATKYMGGLSEGQRRVVLTFLETWGDFIIETGGPLWRLARGRHAIGLTRTAKEVVQAYDLFPGTRKARATIANLRPHELPDGRNGVSYGKRSLRALGLYDK